MSRNLVFVGNGYVMQILDVYIPSSPSLLGEVTLDQEPTDIAILGNYAYVLSMSTLFVVDITDPVNPVEMGSEVIPDQGMITPFGVEVAVTSGYAYAAVGELGCVIFNVTNPANPEIIDTITNYGWGIYSAAVSGDYLYLAYPSAYVYDISTPSNPTYLGSYGSYVDYNEVADGTAAAIAYTCGNNSWDEEGVFDIIDFSSDPGSPTLLGSYTNADWYINNFTVNGNFAYVAESEGLWSTGQQRLEVLNITTPSSPSSSGNCLLPYLSISDFDVSGNYVGMSHYHDGFSLYDVSIPASPTEVLNYDTPDFFPLGGKPIVLSGEYAYVANRDDGLRILDISTPSDVAEVGRCETVDAQAGIAVAGSYVLGVDNTGLWIVDVSNPLSPVELPHYDISWSTSGVAVSGQYAFVSGSESVSSTNYARLHILDIANPASPSFIGSYECTEESSASGKLAVCGDYAYLILGGYLGDSNDDCLKIIDISNAASPAEVGSLPYDNANIKGAIAVGGDYAYLLSDNLHVIDVSNPLSPYEETSVPLSRYSSDIELSGNFAYVASQTLTIFDVSDPTSPYEAGYYLPDSYDGDSIAVSGNYAYVLGSLHVLKNTLAPDLSITSPADWATVSGSVSIGADASHTSGITQVEFYVDGALEGTDMTAPYSYDWNSTAVENGLHTIRARAYNTDGNSSDFDITVNVSNAVDPVADIKANGSDTPITITRSDVLTINISLDTGTHAGTAADWWLIAKTPLGWFHYDLSQDWLPGKVVSRQESLINIPNYEVLNRSGLPKGTYFFIFGVDLNMNGVIDMADAYYDRVKVTIN
jgi:hypothetical protein